MDKEIEDLELSGEDSEEADYDPSATAKVGEEIQLTSDGGLKKTILVEGIGYEKPEPGDTVHVHYVGTLEDGTKFDSSRDRNEAFTFTLGQGNVIKGWDQGVKTMKKGEKSKLECRSDYGYGDAGSPPKIPSKATLIFEVELISWDSVKDMSGDGGVIKKIIKEGSGYENAKDMDIVRVKYEAKIKGQKEAFDKTPEEGIEFSLDEGHLCPALPIAIKKMKEGEIALLTVKPQYGFGEEEGKIVPAGSILEISIKLIGWKKVESLTENGSVIKTTLVKGKGWEKPKEGSTVHITYKGYIEKTNQIFDQRGEGMELEFIVDEEQVVSGLDRAVQQMMKEEEAKIRITSEEGFGNSDHKVNDIVIPGGSTIVYEIKLIDMKNPKNAYEMNSDEKIENALKLKEKGNQAFKNGKLERANRKYDAAIKLIDYDKDFEDKHKKEAKDAKKSIWLNMAAVSLKLKDFSNVKTHCSKVLEIDSSNVKALYRRCQAYMFTNDFVEAEQDIKNARILEPKNKDLIILFKQLKEKTKTASKQEAKLYATMFEKLSKLKDEEKKEVKDSSAMEVDGTDEAGPSGSS